MNAALPLPHARGLSLHAVSSTDEPFLSRLFQTTREELAFLPPSLVRMQFEAQSKDYERRFGVGGRSILTFDGEAIGQLWVHRGASELRLVDISLVPEHRGAGHGTTIIEALKREAKTRNHALRLSVFSSSRAGRLYGRLGFRLVRADGVYSEMEYLE